MLHLLDELLKKNKETQQIQERARVITKKRLQITRSSKFQSHWPFNGTKSKMWKCERWGRMFHAGRRPWLTSRLKGKQTITDEQWQSSIDHPNVRTL